jgi:hypothetical protein
MQHARSVACAAVVAALLATRHSSAGAQAADTSRIDAAAMAALAKMGTYLRTLNAFQVTGVVTTDDVNEDGQMIQSTKTINLLAQRPNHLAVDIVSDRQPRQMYYDGKTFTLYAPKLKFYTQIPAPSTIAALADTLEEKYALEFPFVDLFRWGTPSANADTITSARSIGPATIDGVTCEQYAFRQDGLDWQVWMQAGDYPLPRKLVLTTTTDDARPQHQATYTWNLAPSFNDKAFAFTIPADAKKITLADAEQMRKAAAAAKKSGGDKRGDMRSEEFHRSPSRCCCWRRSTWMRSAAAVARAAAADSAAAACPAAPRVRRSRGRPADSAAAATVPAAVVRAHRTSAARARRTSTAATSIAATLPAVIIAATSTAVTTSSTIGRSTSTT